MCYLFDDNIETPRSESVMYPTFWPPPHHLHYLIALNNPQSLAMSCNLYKFLTIIPVYFLLSHFLIPISLSLTHCFWPMSFNYHWSLTVDPSNCPHHNQTLEELDLQALNSYSAYDSGNEDDEDEESELEADGSEFTCLTPVSYSIFFCTHSPSSSYLSVSKTRVVITPGQ